MLEHTKFQFCPRCSASALKVFIKNGYKCENCGHIYFHNCAAAAAGIIETPDGIVLIRRGQDPGKGMLDLPGGFVDYGETFEQALTREIMEEIGVAVSDLRYFCSMPNIYDYEDVRYFTLDTCFLCLVTAADLAAVMNVVNEETLELLVVRPEELDIHTIAFSSTKRIVEKYCEGSRKH